MGKNEYFEETEFGFKWGSAEISRMCSDKGWVIMRLITPKYADGMQIYVTKSGKVRIWGKGREEWRPSEQEKPNEKEE